MEWLSKHVTPGAMNDHYAHDQTIPTFTNMADRMLDHIMETNNIAHSVSSHVRKLDESRKRHPVRLFLVGLLGAGIAFLCGVIVPMFWLKVPSLLILWIPVFFISSHLAISCTSCGTSSKSSAYNDNDIQRSLYRERRPPNAEQDGQRPC